MMKKLIAITYIAAITALPAKDAFAADGLIAVESPHDVATTVDKLVAVLESKGMNIFARINHEEGASKAGMKLRPTELLVLVTRKLVHLLCFVVRVLLSIYLRKCWHGRMKMERYILATMIRCI